jgi:hypothetical protein
MDAVAGWNTKTDTLHIMAYNFKNDVNYKYSADMTFKIKVPQFDGQTVKVTKYVIDDSSNFFDDWQKDRKTYNITDACFTWSPDDPALDSTTTLTAQWARDIYFKDLRPKYEECSKLIPATETVQVKNGCLTLNATAAPNAVIFYDIEAVQT